MWAVWLGVFSYSSQTLVVLPQCPGCSEWAGLSVPRLSLISYLLWSPADTCAHHPDGDICQACEYRHSSAIGLGTGQVTSRH